MLSKKQQLFFFIIVSLALVYFFTRLYNIKEIPIFTDEAIYILWAHLGKFEPDKRLISLSDGKPPLFIWLVSLIMQFIRSPLAAGRIASILTGAGTAIGIFLFTQEIFNKNRIVSFLSVILYIISPFALVYNRMALMESTAGFFLILSVYIGILLARRLQPVYSLILALLLGANILTKPPGIISILLQPLALIIASFSKLNKKKIFMYVLQLSIAILLAFLYFSVVFLSPFAGVLKSKNSEFVYTFSKLKIQNFLVNFLTISRWLIVYITPPLFIIGIFSFLTKKYLKEKIFFLLWILLPVIFYAFIGKRLYPRYFYPISLFFIPLVGITLYELIYKFKDRLKRWLLFFVLTGFSIYSSYMVIAEFAKSPIPQDDLFQYINGWPAGGGISETIHYLQKEAQDQSIHIETEGIYGSLPTTAVELYFYHYPQVEKHSFWPVPETIPEELLEKAKEKPTYVIFNITQNPPNWPMTLVQKYRKGNSSNYLRLFKLNPHPR